MGAGGGYQRGSPWCGSGQQMRGVAEDRAGDYRGSRGQRRMLWYASAEDTSTQWQGHCPAAGHDCPPRRTALDGGGGDGGGRRGCDTDRHTRTVGGAVTPVAGTDRHGPSLDVTGRHWTSLDVTLSRVASLGPPAQSGVFIPGVNSDVPPAPPVPGRTAPRRVSRPDQRWGNGRYVLFR